MVYWKEGKKTRKKLERIINNGNLFISDLDETLNKRPSIMEFMLKGMGYAVSRENCDFAFNYFKKNFEFFIRTLIMESPVFNNKKEQMKNSLSYDSVNFANSLPEKMKKIYSGKVSSLYSGVEELIGLISRDFESMVIISDGLNEIKNNYVARLKPYIEKGTNFWSEEVPYIVLEDGRISTKVNKKRYFVERVIYSDIIGKPEGVLVFGNGGSDSQMVGLLHEVIGKENVFVAGMNPKDQLFREYCDIYVTQSWIPFLKEYKKIKQKH
ncbi:hypothetical protein JW949_02215 [Candidatus Woesearchaeota archaeon]|nr:hypothetical protein [Candidatus Woesearchaeota archaeon]